MNKRILLLLLLTISLYANKNWIKLDSELIDNSINNNVHNNMKHKNDLKMYTSQSSLNRIKSENKNQNSSDKKLLDLIKTIHTATQKLKPKITNKVDN